MISDPILFSYVGEWGEYSWEIKKKNSHKLRILNAEIVEANICGPIPNSLCDESESQLSAG